MRCQRTLLNGLPAVRKEPDTPADTARLDQERRWLTLAAHPGVVRLLPATNASAIWTRDIGERSLASLGTLDPTVICGLGAAAATILADLHDLGIVHGAPCADHLLVDTEGRPVLCSLSRASSATAPGAREDVRILAEALLQASGQGAPRRLGQLLGRAAGPSRAPTARQLARDLTRASPRPALAAPATTQTRAGAAHRPDHDHPSRGSQPRPRLSGPAPRRRPDHHRHRVRARPSPTPTRTAWQRPNNLYSLDGHARDHTKYTPAAAKGPRRPDRHHSHSRPSRHRDNRRTRWRPAPPLRCEQAWHRQQSPQRRRPAPRRQRSS